MIYVLIILHAVDAVLTWRFGRNTEYGLIFKKLVGSPWKFWPARAAFFAVIFIGCEIYYSHFSSGLYWFAIGEQMQAIMIIARGFVGLAVTCTITGVAIVGVAILVDFKMSAVFALGAILMFLYSAYAKRRSCV